MGIVRVPGVVADFRVPPGWPKPTDKWVRDNALWQPPPGWIPLEALSPAPASWQFWRPNPLWKRLHAREFRAAETLQMVASAFSIGGLAVVVAVALFDDIIGLRYLALIAGAGAIGCLIVSGVLSRRARRQTLASAGTAAADARGKRLVRDYQRYLGIDQ